MCHSHEIEGNNDLVLAYHPIDTVSQRCTVSNVESLVTPNRVRGSNLDRLHAKQEC